MIRMVDTAALLRAIDEGVRTARMMQCTSCGAETPVVDVIGFCTWCENIVYRQAGDIERTDVWRGEVLTRIIAGRKEGKYEDIINAYNEMTSISAEAGIQYAMGLMMIEYSNYETSRIGYEKDGFMESNIAHRDRARDLYSKAKMRLNKAISLADISIGQNVHQASNLYIKFLCQIKLGKPKPATLTLKKIRALNEEYIASYCDIVIAVSLKNYAKGLEMAQKLLAGKSFTINAFYYAAFCLMKMGKKREAALILSKLKESVPMAASSLARNWGSSP